MKCHRDTARAGFTLTEMLIAATLGALLLTAAASTAGSFSETVAQLQTDAVDSYENVVARMDRDVRYAWYVDVPSRDRLEVVGPDNLVTTYYLLGNSLLVTRPDGSTGSILTGLSDVTFEQDLMQRLRSDRDTWVNNVSMGRVTAPALAVPTMNALGNSTITALSFMAPSDAGARMVSGVSDRYTEWRPLTLEMLLARTGSGTVTFTIYPAFGPGRAEPRPGAAAIGSWTVALSGIPAGVVLAAPPAVPRPVYAVPAATVNIAIPNLGRNLETGVAYTLTMQASAGSQIITANYASASRTDEMYKTSVGAWTALGSTIAFEVRANAGCTTTFESDVTTQVRTTLESQTGEEYVGSACVYSQVLAEDPWLGVVPGELPSN